MSLHPWIESISKASKFVNVDISVEKIILDKEKEIYTYYARTSRNTFSTSGQTEQEAVNNLIKKISKEL